MPLKAHHVLRLYLVKKKKTVTGTYFQIQKTMIYNPLAWKQIFISCDMIPLLTSLGNDLYTDSKVRDLAELNGKISNMSDCPEAAGNYSKH